MSGTGSYGTGTTLDTLRLIDAQTVLTFGEDRILDALNLELGIVNQQVTEALRMFCEDTRENADRGYGLTVDLEMVDVGEAAIPHVQSIQPNTAGNIGYPMRRSEIILQWTLDAFENMTPAEIALQIDATVLADRRRIFRDLKRAIYLSGNYTFIDVWGKGLSLPVKRLVNADGYYIPPGPDGTKFVAATHTHYLATAALTAADVKAGINTVVEHYDTGGIEIVIHKNQEAAFIAMTSDFVPLPPPNIVQASTATTASGVLDVMHPTNRLIGYFNGMPVRTKPWAISGYIFFYNTGVRRPVVRRVPALGTADLRLIYQDEGHALRGQAFRRQQGFGIRERTNGAVLYVGGGTYVDPTIN